MKYELHKQSEFRLLYGDEHAYMTVWWDAKRDVARGAADGAFLSCDLNPGGHLLS